MDCAARTLLSQAVAAAAQRLEEVKAEYNRIVRTATDSRDAGHVLAAAALAERVALKALANHRNEHGC